MARAVVLSDHITLPEMLNHAGQFARKVHGLLNAEGGVWCGWSGIVSETPSIHWLEQGRAAFCRLDYTQQEYQDYYQGFCRGLLWPVLHFMPDKMHYARPMFDAYYAMNRRFAVMVAEQLESPEDIIWVHDYPFMAVGKYLREMECENRAGFFLHQPFPPPEVLALMPRYIALLNAMAAYDVIGFESERDLRNFCRSIMELAGAKTIRPVENGVEVAFGSRRIWLGHYPVTVSPDELAQPVIAPEAGSFGVRFREHIGNRKLVIGMDALDNSKGLPERLNAFQCFLTNYPDMAEHCVYMQLTPPELAEAPDYAQLRVALEQKVAQINAVHAPAGQTPLHYYCQGMERTERLWFYREAEVALATPLYDATDTHVMEYIAAQRPDQPGVLILSQFTGVAEHLDGALVVNPYDAEAVASALYQAFFMSSMEKRARYGALMSQLRDMGQYDWVGAFLHDVEAPSFPPAGVPTVTYLHRLFAMR